MKFAVELSRDAARYIRRLDVPTRERIAKAVRELAADPFGPSTKPLADRYGRRAMRVGGWRILYRVDVDQGLISITDIGPRGQIYRQLGR